jgi:hypothetical protein
MEEKQAIVGSCLFSSINCHNRVTLSRRDDIISFFYMLIYLIKGSLPWSFVEYSSILDKWSNVLKIKQSVESKKLCEGLPAHFKTMMDYCFFLDYKEKPNYKYLIHLFRKFLNNTKASRVYFKTEAVKNIDMYNLLCTTEKAEPPSFFNRRRLNSVD